MKTTIIVGGMKLLLTWTRLVVPTNDRLRASEGSNDQ